MKICFDCVHSLTLAERQSNFLLTHVNSFSNAGVTKSDWIFQFPKKTHHDNNYKWSFTTIGEEDYV